MPEFTFFLGFIMMDYFEDYNPVKMIDRAVYRKLKWLSWSKAIAANSNGSQALTLSDDAHFLCRYLGGEFTSLTAESTDGGANGISIKLTDNGKSYPMFDNLIPVSIFLTPGRARSSGIAGDPSNPLFSPIEFYHPFSAGTSIQIEYANALAYENTLTLVFYGEYVAKEEMPSELR